MSKVKYICNYCGNEWVINHTGYFYLPNDEDKKCSNCGDTNIIKKKVANNNCFGYNNEQDEERLRVEDDGPNYD